MFFQMFSHDCLKIPVSESIFGIASCLVDFTAVVPMQLLMHAHLGTTESLSVHAVLFIIIMLYYKISKQSIVLYFRHMSIKYYNCVHYQHEPTVYI